MPAFAIKDALLWRSQLHRQTVISFFFVSVLLAILTLTIMHVEKKHTSSCKSARMRIVKAIYEEYKDKAMHGLYLLQSCVFNSLSKSNANDAESPAAVALRPG